MEDKREPGSLSTGAGVLATDSWVDELLPVGTTMEVVSAGGEQEASNTAKPTSKKALRDARRLFDIS